MLQLDALLPDGLDAEEGAQRKADRIRVMQAVRRQKHLSHVRFAHNVAFALEFLRLFLADDVRVELCDLDIRMVARDDLDDDVALALRRHVFPQRVVVYKLHGSSPLSGPGVHNGF